MRISDWSSDVCSSDLHGFDPEIWQRLAGELGWCAMPVAEAHGGLGLGPVEMAVLMESMGRRLFCAPYFSTACLAATLIAETAREDSQAGPLAAIVEGRMLFGVAIADTSEEPRVGKESVSTCSSGGWPDH